MENQALFYVCTKEGETPQGEDRQFLGGAQTVYGVGLGIPCPPDFHQMDDPLWAEKLQQGQDTQTVKILLAEVKIRLEFTVKPCPQTLYLSQSGLTF